MSVSVRGMKTAEIQEAQTARSQRHARRAEQNGCFLSTKEQADLRRMLAKPPQETDKLRRAQAAHRKQVETA